MNQKTYEQIINAGQAVDITPELMATARERANRERSAAIRSGTRWIKMKLAKLTSVGRTKPACRYLLTAGVVGDGLITASQSQAAAS